MALTELVNGTKLPKQIISTALGVSRLHDALWSGYRHFYEEIKDTDDDNEDPYAHFPMTKEPHGDIAVTLKMYRQPKLKRKNLYITVNFAKKVNDKPSFEEAIEDAFQTMKFDYFDALLLDQAVFGDDDELMTELCHSLEELYEKGCVGALGVANFSIEQVEKLRKKATVAPMIFKTGYFPMSLNDDIYDYCQQNHLQIMADFPFLDYSFVDLPTMGKIASKYRVENDELMCQYAQQRHVMPIIKKFWVLHAHNPLEQNYKITINDLHRLERLDNASNEDWLPLKDYGIFKIFQSRAIDHDRMERSGEEHYSGFPPFVF